MRLSGDLKYFGIFGQLDVNDITNNSWILFKAFTDMQVNKIETTKKLKMLELQAEMLKTSKKSMISPTKKSQTWLPTQGTSPHLIVYVQFEMIIKAA